MSEFVSTLIANVQQRPVLLVQHGIWVLFALHQLWLRRRTPAPWDGFAKYNNSQAFFGVTTIVLLMAAPESTTRVTLVALCITVSFVLVVLDWRNTKQVKEAIKHAPPPPADQIASPTFLFRIALGTSVVLAAVGVGMLVTFGTAWPILITALIAFAGAVSFAQIAYKKLRGVR